MPPLTRNVTALASPAAVEPAAARPHPGGGGRKLPRTKELSENDEGTWGERGGRGPGAQRLCRCREPGLKLRRVEAATPRRSRPRARPGKRRLFSRGRAGLFPGCALTSLTHAPEATPSTLRNHPKTEKKETRNIKKLKRRKPSTHASRGTQGRDHCSDQPTGHHSRRSARDRLLCAVGCSGSGPAPSPPALAKSSGLPAARPPRARSPAGAERFVPSGSQRGGNRLVTS